MTSVIIMALIGGLLSTLFVNIHFIRQFIKGLRLCFVKTPPDNEKDSKNGYGSARISKKKFDFAFDEFIPFLITQIIIFIIVFVILLCWYYFAAADRTVSQILISTGWVIGIAHLVNWFIVAVLTEGYWFEHDCPEGFTCCAVIISVLLLVISWGGDIAGSCYNYSHQQETTTFLQEENVPVVSVDTLKTLESEVLIDGYQLGNAINRNGKVVIPLSREENVNFAGYVVIEDNQPTIIKKNLRYTPNHNSTCNPSMVAREYMPTKIFFGNWSFQLKPTENGEDEVYYVCTYGTFKWLRAGRNVEGMMFVNAETGDFSTCTLEEVPAWVSGVSQ